MKLEIFDTLTGTKQKFDPIDEKRVRMYVCGPTVYDLAHIGNARPIIIFDVFYRILRAIYGSKNVEYARNITDIDDKIIESAHKKNITTYALTKKTTKFFHEDISMLNVLKPNFEPKATETIPEMILMISDLIKKEFAYIANDHVIFDTKKSKEYGKLSKRTIDDMIAGSRVEVAPYKKNPSDFILWKPSKSNEPGWESPWGVGRPGWHIECSAMTKKYLGLTFDVHAGGADLIFPHHENEIAQSESLHGKPFAKYWMHNGYLNIQGEKMSKSIGNILTLRELLKDYNGEVLRFAMLSTHYRQPINFSYELLKSSSKQLDKIYTSINLRKIKENYNSKLIPSSLLDDINTPMAISEIHELVKRLNKQNINDKEWIECKNKIRLYGELMGLFNKTPDEWFKKSKKLLNPEEEKEINLLIEERNFARQNSNFELADKIREKLKEKGIIIEDIGDKSNWKMKDGR